MAAGSDGALYLSDGARLRKVAGGVITTVAGNGAPAGGDGGPAAKAQLVDPVGLARDAAGNTYVADYFAANVRRIDAGGRITTFAGSTRSSIFTGGPSSTGDGGPATAARLAGAIAVAADTRGNVFILERSRVRKVDPTGVITTVAGGGSATPGDGGPATSVALQDPIALAVDAGGNFYVAEKGNGRVRKVGLDGRIATVAGGGTEKGDGVPATSAELALVAGASLAVDPLGQLHIGQAFGGRVRKVDLAGVISTVVNLGNSVSGLAFDANGDLYLVTSDNTVVRLDPLGGRHVVAGKNELAAGLGDGGPAVEARLGFLGLQRSPALMLDGAGNLYLTDTGNHRVRRVEAVSTARRVFATGWNGFGQLGDASTTDRLLPVAAGVGNARSVAAGYFHSLAVKADGSVWSWGLNVFGQLGDGTTVDRTVPTRVKGLDGVVAVAAGAYTSLAIRADGTVWSWGWNGFGMLGDGTTTDRHTPVRVTGLPAVAKLAAGAFHVLALTPTGEVWSWGLNHVGQLGTGSVAAIETRPGRVPGSTGATSVAAGVAHSLATGLYGDSGGIYAWGWNVLGQLGDGTTIDRRTPVRLAHLGEVAAGGYHNVANGRAWGWNALSQLAIPSGGDLVVLPSPALVPTEAIVAAGLAHTAALYQDGTVLTWGWNPYGALGDGTTTTRARPAAIAGVRGVAVSSGALHTLIVG